MRRNHRFGRDLQDIVERHYSARNEPRYGREKKAEHQLLFWTENAQKVSVLPKSS